MASLKQYIKDHYFLELEKVGGTYLVEHAYELGIDVDWLVGELIVQYSKIQYVYAGQRDDNLIDIDVLLDVYAKNSYYNERFDYCSSLHNRWFRISCTALVDEGLKNFVINSIYPYQKGTNNLFEKKLDDSLLPYLQNKFEEETEKIAEDIIKRYYPDSLVKAQTIDSIDFASKLGLDIEYRKISDDLSVYGRIYFEDDPLEVVLDKTIVIDSRLSEKRNQATVNIAIVHECIHWILHRLAIELENGNKDSANDESLVKWMEQQAWAIVPKVVMPRKATQNFVKTIYADWKIRKPEIEVIDVVKCLIKEVATTFNVPQVSAKKRLAELGIEEALGALEFVDDRYVPQHRWRQGFLSPNQTFTIGTYDLAKLLKNNEVLKNHLENGSLIYIESHVCLNDGKYINNTGETAQLTLYARNHMDECCLVFTKHRETISNPQGFTLIKALNNSLEAKISPVYKYQTSSTNLGIEEEANLLIQQGKELRKLKGDLPRTSFGDCLRYLRKWRNLSNEDLAEEALLSSTYISNLQNNKVKDVKLRTVVALCIALSLPNEICRNLIELSGRSLRDQSEEEDMLYNLFLVATSNYTVEHCNKILMKQNLRTLTDKNEIH